MENPDEKVSVLSREDDEIRDLVQGKSESLIDLVTEPIVIKEMSILDL